MSPFRKSPRTTCRRSKKYRETVRALRRLLKTFKRTVAVERIYLSGPKLAVLLVLGGAYTEMVIEAVEHAGREQH